MFFIGDQLGRDQRVSMEDGLLSLRRSICWLRCVDDNLLKVLDSIKK